MWPDLEEEEKDQIPSSVRHPEHRVRYSFTWSFSRNILNHDREKFLEMLKDVSITNHEDTMEPAGEEDQQMPRPPPGLHMATEKLKCVLMPSSPPTAAAAGSPEPDAHDHHHDQDQDQEKTQAAAPRHEEEEFTTTAMTPPPPTSQAFPMTGINDLLEDQTPWQ